MPHISFGCFVCVVSFQESLFKTFWAFAFLLPSVACFAIYFSHEKPTRMLYRLCRPPGSSEQNFSELSGQFSGRICLQHSLLNIVLLTKNTFHKTSYLDEKCLLFYFTHTKHCTLRKMFSSGRPHLAAPTAAEAADRHY